MSTPGGLFSYKASLSRGDQRHVRSSRRLQPKRVCLPLTRFASRKWRSGLNGISHPDWVKFSVELNSAPKQNTRFSSSLQPVCGWIRAATGVLKRRATVVTKGWDDIVDDNSLKQMMAETLTRVCRSDPARGEWHVSGHKLNAWVDTSSLATCVVLERFGTVLENACCLCPKNDAQHINLTELDAMLKGLNLVLQWLANVVYLYTDSLCIYHWLSDTNWKDTS